MTKKIYILACASTAVAGASRAHALVAFPGAEGYGAVATGGRGGDVYHVTSLADTNTNGTLRYGLGHAPAGGRTVVFDVSGMITLGSRIAIDHPNITIAGQTAPGQGITLANHDLLFNADNVIVRYIRSRVGDQGVSDDDSMWGRYHSNIILDHIDASWSIDECLSLYDNNANVTVQYSMATESLYHSHHEKGNHGYGGIWGGNGASWHHNLIAHNSSRNPRFAGINTNVDFRNNVVYNWGFNSAYGGEDGATVNMVNNYFKYGPGTDSSKRNRIVEPTQDAAGTWTSRWYIDGNYVWGYPAITADNWAGGVQGSAPLATIRSMTPFGSAGIATQTALEAYDTVLANVGVNLWRDSIDTRIVTEVKTGTATYDGTWNPNYNAGAISGIIDSQAQVGGWPAYPVVNRPADWDTDGDGMPNWWETARGLSTSISENNLTTLTPGGYTNIEHYLNYLALFAQWNTNASSTWGTVSNWVGFVPNVTDATAIFGPVITAGRTITVNGNKTVGQMLFDSPFAYTLSGSSTLTMQVISGTGAIDVLSGSHTITAPVNLANDVGVSIASGSTLTMTNLDASAVKLTKSGAGNLIVNNVRADALVVTGGSVQVAANGGNSGVSRVNSLSIDPAAALNLTNNDLIVNNGSFAAIEALVESGYSSTPDPARAGIISSTSQNSGGATILALFDNTTFGLTEWAGQTVGASAIIGKYTYFGDADFNGMVTGDDYLVLDANLGTAPAPGVAWLAGDMNFDGTVTGDDYLVLDANLGLGVGNPLGAAAVPEPAGLGLIGLMLGARQRRHRARKKR